MRNKKQIAERRVAEEHGADGKEDGTTLGFNIRKN